MKNKLFSFTGTLVALIMLKEPTCHSSAATPGSLMPLAVGNQWIYRDSVVENGKLISVTNDTVKVEKAFSFEGSPAFALSDGKEFLIHGDTLSQLVTQRGGYKFATPFFISTKNETQFNYAFGGDVMIQRTIKKMTECPNGEWKSPGCYRVSDGCRGEIIFGYGIGIISERRTECSSPGENYSSRTLIGIELNK